VFSTISLHDALPILRIDVRLLALRRVQILSLSLYEERIELRVVRVREVAARDTVRRVIADPQDAVGVDARRRRRRHVVLVRADVVEIRAALHHLDLEIDPDVAKLRLHRLCDLGPGAAEGRERDLEILAVLLPDRTRALLPSGVVEELLRLRRVERERLLDRVVARPDAFRERTDRHVVDAEEDLFDDRLPVD